MCGVAGIVGQTDENEALARLGRMLAVLARRGPDNEGREVLADAVLGHRRLAIFDLTKAGNQPMFSADRSVSLVFNGSIYNYRELRSELASQGMAFRSETDTEVLVNGYLEWGLQRMLPKLKGMFAFGLWDSRLKKLFLVRDRLGVKPLSYVVAGNTIAFASTSRSLRAGGFVGELDPEAVLAFLALGFVPDDMSIYKGMVKVPPATVVEWSDGRLLQWQYWFLPQVDNSAAWTFREAVERTEDLLLKAVQSRLYAHVPLGALLSGGVDSALVCWAAAKLGGNLTTFTVGVPGDPCDETLDAISTAQQLGLPHRVLEMTVEEDPNLSDLVSAYSEPFAAASALGMLRISKAVSQQVKVLLTGDGGDDVFLGYPRHRHLWLAAKAAVLLPERAKQFWLDNRGVIPRKGPLRRLAAFLDYTAGDFTAYLDLNRRLSAPYLGGLFGDRLREAVRIGAPRNGDESLHDLRDGLSLLFQHDYQSSFVGEYLVKVDGATMYHGIEARSPLLDQDLWEFAAALPYKLRLHHGSLKALLRTIAMKVLGTRVARRRKSGFGIPVQRWVAGPWRSHVDAAFADSTLAAEGWIVSSKVRSVLQQSTGCASSPEYLWYLYVLESWLRAEQNLIDSSGGTILPLGKSVSG